MSERYKFPDSEWLPSLLHAMHVDALRRFRNRMIDSELIDSHRWAENEKELEATIQELAEEMSRRTMDYIDVEQEKQLEE